MDAIIIRELEVFYHVGVTDQERAQPQKLLLNLELQHDFSPAAATDDLTQTIDYAAVCQRLLRFGEGRSWKLLETLAVEIASLLTGEFRAKRASVQIQKFIIVEARWVGVQVIRP